MQSEEQLPHVPDDLLKLLQERFPSECPHPSDDDRVIWMKVGAYGVIEFLQDLKSSGDDPHGFDPQLQLRFEKNHV